MSLGEIDRLNYYRDQTLGVDDFVDQQEYHRDMRRRHNLAHHTWGLISGLELVETPVDGTEDTVEVTVRPGFAIDGYGREIVVLDPYKLDPSNFAAHRNKATRKLWIAYDERFVRRVRANECEPDDLYSRIVESFRIVVDPSGKPTDEIVVAGREVFPPPGLHDVVTPVDDSVPHQEFPDEDDDPRWLVRLGGVLWDGQAGVFRPAGSSLTKGRRYGGAVAEELLAPADRLRLRARDKPSEPKDTDDLVGVEGTMRVDGTFTARQGVRLDGDKLEFRDNDGGSDPPFEIYRKDDAALRVRLGETEEGTQFVVGTGDDDDFEEKLVVHDTGNVDVHGRLVVEGEARVNERLSIRDPSGQDPGGAVRLERLSNDGGGNDLRAVLGASSSGAGRLVVGSLDAGDFEEKVILRGDGSVETKGPLKVGGDVEVDGGVIDLRLADGGTDTDIMTIGRVNVGADQNDMRVVIGDNDHAGDHFRVGPSVAGTFQPCLTVTNNGYVEVDRNLHVGGGLTFGGSGASMPVDVVTGTLDMLSNASTGEEWFQVPSRLPYVSSATAMVSLNRFASGGIGGWSVSVNVESTERVNDTMFRFKLVWACDWSTYIDSVQYTVVYVP